MTKNHLPKNYLYYLDLLRVFLTMLVFYHHAAIAFGASGGWYYVVDDKVQGIQQGLLSLTMGIDQSYFMSLFFFISAYLMPGSYDRKGIYRFVLDRINRLGIPLLIYVFLLNPLLISLIWGSRYEYGFGPMWFVFTLILFEGAYVIYRKISLLQIKRRIRFPNVLQIVFFMLLMGASAFIVRLVIPTGSAVFGLQLGYFPLYIGFYVLGIIAYRNQWLDKLLVSRALPWFTIVLLLGIPAILYVGASFSDQFHLLSGGWNPIALFYAFWEPLMCVGICYFLLAYTKQHFNNPSRVIRWLAVESYAFYIIHPFIVVGCTLWVEQLEITPLVGLLVVCIVGIPLCFFTGALFRQFLLLIRVKI